jgi:predicted AAA+ superfamily ATPase
VVEEILKEIEKGKKIIFVHGVCGTGKSLIALNLARHLGKTSIIVSKPVRNKQGRTIAVLAGRASLEYLNKIMKERSPAHCFFVILSFFF